MKVPGLHTRKKQHPSIPQKDNPHNLASDSEDEDMHLHTNVLADLTAFGDDSKSKTKSFNPFSIKKQSLQNPDTIDPKLTEIDDKDQSLEAEMRRQAIQEMQSNYLRLQEEE